MNLQASVEQSGAVITWDDLPAVHAHEIRMVQLLQNLIGNAIEYRGEDPPQIHVAARTRRSGNGVFSVQDNGIGIEPEYAQQILRFSTPAWPGLSGDRDRIGDLPTDRRKIRRADLGGVDRGRLLLLLHAAPGQGPRSGGAGGLRRRAPLR